MTLAGRWDQLAADLSAQAEALDARQRAGEVEERLRHEVGQLRLIDRLGAALGGEIVVSCPVVGRVHGVLARLVSDALLIREPPHRECLIPVSQVLSISGIPRFSAADPSRVDSRIGMRVLLRAIARDRSAVKAALLDGSVVDGTIDRVGSDFLELAAHPTAEGRRRSVVREVLMLPLGALVAVRREGA